MNSSRNRNNFILDLGHSSLPHRQINNNQQFVLNKQNDSFPSIAISIKGGILTSRIHSQQMNQKREQKILTSHKKKRVAVSNQHQLPSLGCTERSEKIKIRFPPQKLKKTFAT